MVWVKMKGEAMIVERMIAIHRHNRSWESSYRTCDDEYVTVHVGASVTKHRIKVDYLRVKPSALLSMQHNKRQIRQAIIDALRSEMRVSPDTKIELPLNVLVGDVNESKS